MNPPRCPSGQWVRLCAANAPASGAAGPGPLFEPPPAAAPRPGRAPHPEPLRAASQARKGRAGRITTGLRLHPEVHEQLRSMAFHENVPIQALLEEGIELLLRSRRQG